MKKYEIYSKKMEVGDNNMVILSILDKTKKQMDVDDLVDVMEFCDTKIQAIKNKKKRNRARYIIRGLSPAGWRTLKSYNSNQAIHEIGEYWRGRANDPSRLDHYTQFQVCFKL